MSLTFCSFCLFNNGRTFWRWLAHSGTWLLLNPFSCPPGSGDKRADLGISCLIFGATTKYNNSPTGIIRFPRTDFIVADVIQGSMSACRKSILFILFNWIKHFFTNSWEFTLTANPKSIVFCEFVFIGNQCLCFWGFAIIQEMKVISWNHKS